MHKLRIISRVFKSFLVVAFVIAVTTVAVAQNMTAEHNAKTKFVSSSVISTDGKYVAYTLSVPGDAFKENVAPKNFLHVLNTTSGTTTPYFTSASVGAVAFRPAKGTITFLSKAADDATNAIYEININGGEASKIFSTLSSIVNYAWSKDGNQVVYSVKEAAKIPQTPLSYKPDFYEEEFGTQKGYIVDLSSSKKESRVLNVPGSVYLMTWSNDGSKIAVSVTPTLSVDDSYMKQQVLIVDAKNGNVIRTIENKGKLGQITWSPDGKQLALKAAKDINDPADGRILIVPAEGTKPAIIDENFLGQYDHISWTDAGIIHFHASEGTGSMLGAIKPDGTGKQVIFKSADHAITNFSRAGNGAISFVASTPSHPGELFTIAATKNAMPVKRTDSNPWLSEVKLGKQEVIRYAARDKKYEIEGILIYPVNYQAGTTVPLITVVHGGPEAHYSNGWLTGYSSPGQLAASNGYAVFYPNYRGSTGRGIDFIYTSQGDPGGKEFDDIIDGIDFLIGKGIVDKSRVGVTGGSYGGYASAWMSTFYSERFAATVMFVGISNNLSLWGTSDIPQEMFHVHFRKYIWDDWQFALERSPVYYVDRAQTPILIMHGANDPRVHPGQSQELYRHLKIRKPELPVRLIYYPGEGHGNTRSGSRYDFNIRMMQWFDTYLKSGNPKAEMPALDLPVKK